MAKLQCKQEPLLRTKVKPNTSFYFYYKTHLFELHLTPSSLCEDHLYHGINISLRLEPLLCTKVNQILRFFLLHNTFI